MGKNYANRKPIEKRPEADFYPTPKSLIWKLATTGELDNIKTVLEPACGNYAISNEMSKLGFKVDSKDLKYGNDFLKDNYRQNSYDLLITNPPFSLWSEFVDRGKYIAPKMIMLGKLNFLGTYQRNKDGIWHHLKKVYVFNRMVNYESPFRQDGKFQCGVLVTGWFIWDQTWNYDWWQTEIMDVQDYVVSQKKISLEKFIKETQNITDFPKTGSSTDWKLPDFNTCIKLCDSLKRKNIYVSESTAKRLHDMNLTNKLNYNIIISRLAEDNFIYVDK